jgi:parallel beta-helix repeat protein
MIACVGATSKTVYVDVANFGDPGQDGSLGHPFDTIQEGVDVAVAGDVVHVASGVYHEYVQIGKSSISLVGENGTVIDGDETGYGLRVGALPPYYAENVSISHFTIQNCVKGVTFVRCRYACFRDVCMCGNTYNFADYSRQVNDIDVSNTVDGKPIYYWVNQYDKQVPLDAGYVVLVNCTGIVIRDLNLTRNGQGLVLKYTSNSVIENVNVSGNQDGIYIDAWNSNNTIADCMVINNLNSGIYISCSSQNTVRDDQLLGNHYGVFLDESSSANIIVNNTIMENDEGIHFDGINGKIQSNVVVANRVLNNTLGISLSHSSGNAIYDNNFVNNMDQAYLFDSADRWDYNGRGNFWSDYVGEDLNNDGVGETPYVIYGDSLDNYPFMDWVVPEFSSLILLFLFTTWFVAILLHWLRMKVLAKPAVE